MAGFQSGKLGLRLIIDGIEVPVIGARTTFPDGSDSSAEIQVIAVDEVFNLTPRSAIALFYFDNEMVGNKYGADGDVSLRNLGPSDLRNWKILFLGELGAVRFDKNSGQRSVTLVCAGPTNQWDFIRQHYVNFTNGGIELFENAFYGVSAEDAKAFDVPTKDIHSNLWVWLTASKGPDGEPNMYLGAHRVLREMYFAANDYYAKQFNRWRTGDMIVGLPNDQTAAKLFRLQSFEKWLKNQLGGRGGHYTLAQLVKMLLGPVFHNTTTIPSPMLDRSGSVRGYTPGGDDPVTDELIDRTSWENATLNHVVVKPDTWFLAPPACNVIFPNQYTTLSYQRNYLQEPTRLFLRTSLIFTGQDKWLTERFYSPDFSSVATPQQFAHGGYLKRLASTVLSHEELVGLNPVETWQEDLSAFVAKGARRTYLAAMADYLFWKYRFSMRTANVAMSFNPNLIPGYPALVMDRAKSGELGRHIVGNVQAIVHSIDQRGGVTHVTLVGARHHDEQIDLDGKGRSLEVIASRGTDGFLDDRYDAHRVGDEVYQKLFGCGSIVDLAGQVNSVDDALLAAISKEEDPVNWSVLALESAYRRASTGGADMERFIFGITHRPKASLPELMGIPTGDELTLSSGNVGSLELLREDGIPDQGFLATAFDIDAADTQAAKFKARRTRYVTQKTVVQVPAVFGSVQQVFDPVTDVIDEVRVQVSAATTRTETKTVQVTAETEGSYDLSGELEERRSYVQLYVDRLKTRGIEG